MWSSRGDMRLMRTHKRFYLNGAAPDHTLLAASLALGDTAAILLVELEVHSCPGHIMLN